MKKTRFITSIALLCTIMACHKNNPCTGLSPVNANFIMQEMQQAVDTNWIPYSTDTFSGTYIQFTALLNGASYEWHIGSGVYTQQSFQLNFNSAPDNSTIPVILIVKKAPDKSCFPTDDGIDTVIHNIHIKRHYTRVLGSYRGYYTDNPNKVFTVYFNRRRPADVSYALSLCYDSTLLYTGGWQITSDQVVGLDPCWQETAQRELFFDATDTSPTDSVAINFGRASLDSTFNNITIDIYPVRGINSNPLHLQTFQKHFKGTRIQ